jgi:hypothetical protein
MANASWGSVDFDVLWDNPFTVPIPPQRHALAIRHVPWGNRTIVQDMGREPAEGTYRAILTTAEYDAALPLIGTTATLDIDGDTARSGVLLRDIDGIERDDTHDEVFVTLTFLVV